MKILHIIIASGLVASASLRGQMKFPATVKPRDKVRLQQQSDAFYKVFDKIASTVTESTVVLKVGDKVIAMGTVTEKGVVTKLSEILPYLQVIRMVDSKGYVHPVKIKATHKDYDLALLENTGKLPELVLEKADAPPVGSFLVAAGASNQALASGILSVASRSLKDSDRGFLGVVMSMDKMPGGGVKLERVEPNTAASRAGLMVGDILLAVDGKSVTNLFEMRNFLQRLHPNDVITISYKRNGQVISGQKVILGGRPTMPAVSRSRMEKMRRMGGSLNRIREGFPEVLQSDMQIDKKFCGAPVLALDSHLVGVVIARSSRIKTYIVEISMIMEAFKGVK